MNIESLAAIVESVTGADPLKEGRARPLVYSRVLLVQVLRTQGWTQQRIADAIGYARLTVQHLCVLFRDAEQYANNPELLKKWNKLKTVLDL